MITLYRKVHKVSIGFLFFGFVCNSSVAQEVSNSIVIGDRVEIYSEILGEERALLIGKPSSYESSADTYPVIYLLDGETHFHHVTGLTKFLERIEQIPEFLVVGIPNTDRNRDLTPDTSNARDKSEYPTHGGADKFLEFLNDELLPFVEKNYRTKSYNLLLGHSFGGLFALHSMLESPDTFDGYIVVSPSLQWDDQHLVSAMEDYFESESALVTDLYITKGNESPSLIPGLPRIKQALENNPREGFRWHIEELSEETHNSVPYRGIHRGIEFIFEEWVVQDYMSVFNESGLNGLIEHYRQSGKRFGYERSFPSGAILGLFGQLGSAGRLEEAAEVLSFYDSAFQPQAAFYEVLAEGYLQKGQGEQALKYFREASEIDFDNEHYKSVIRDLEQSR